MPADRSEVLLRSAYSLALYVLLPVTLYHLIWRGFRQRGYFQRWGERYASYPDPPDSGGCVWLHAVSVGEVNAAAPLVDALLERRPGERLLITTITPTGSERVNALWGDAVEHVYLPYDLPGAVQRFLRRFRPSCALLMETELWPNLLFGCRAQGVPVAIVNARLSARSLRGYRLLAPLLARALAQVQRVAAQSEEDGARFLRLGAPAAALVVTGNLKFDRPPLAGEQQILTEFRTHAGARPVWIAASTHPEEEAAVLAAHVELRHSFPDALLLWAPRHPERFRVVADQVRAAGLQLGQRSRTPWPDLADAVFLIDTLGDLPGFYPCADLAFVGGSLAPVGGHNLLEPAAVGTPVLTGPHLHNFSEISRQLDAAGALRVIPDAEALAPALLDLLRDSARRQAMARAGRALVEAGRGALERTWQALAPLLPQR